MLDTVNLEEAIAASQNETLQRMVNAQIEKNKTSYRNETGEEPPELGSTTLVNTDINEIREVLRYDYKAFCLLLLSEEEGIEEGVPDFHVFGLKKMTGNSPKPVAIAWPRDHAKTTLAKIAVIWLLIYTKFRFPIYVCNTNTMAANALRDVVTMLTKPSFTEIYGIPQFTQKAESVGDYIFKWANKVIIMRALGVGQAVRGMNVNNKRPDILILDDIEKAEEGAENKLGYEGISTWYYGTLEKCLDRRGHKIIQIGNFVASKSLLGDHLASIYWDSTKLAAITKDGKPLWPARWTIDQLRLDLLRYIENGKMGIWLCEMMNMPLNETTALIKSSEIKLTEIIEPDDPNIMLRCITVDPAITRNLKHADSAVVAVHVYKGHKWHLAELHAEKGVGVYQLYARIIELAAKWRVLTVGIEVEAYQEALRQVCATEAARSGLHRMNFVPVDSGKKAKASRIAAFASMIKQGLYGISSKHLYLYQDLLKFDVSSKTNTDDRLDACAYVIHMTDRYLHLMTDLAMAEDVAKAEEGANRLKIELNRQILH